MKHNILEVKKISFSYVKGKKVFDDVSFELKEGEIFTILGTNGAGKSTLLNCISNILQPDNGKIILEGEDIRKLRKSYIASKIGYVPQLHESAFGFSVQDYLVMGRAPYIDITRTPQDKDYEIVENIMRRMGITYLANKSYNEISGGECQLVQIGRALVQESNIIILDEPTNHLDFGNQLKILKLLYLLAEEGKSILFTTHMPDHAILMNGKTGILGHGGKMEIGYSKDIISKESMCSLYGIDVEVLFVEQLNRKTCTYKNI